MKTMAMIFGNLLTTGAMALLGWVLFGFGLVDAQTCRPGDLCNPLQFATIQEFVARVLQIIVAISIPILAFFIVYSGFMFVLAQGSETKLNKAKLNFLWVIAGAFLILGAWALSEMLGATVNQLRP